MVPPAQMLAIKNRVDCASFLVIALAVLLTGCRPPGPRALLDGKRLLDQGKYSEAVGRLETATTLLSTNAQAWNYLGLAYHRAGQPTNAAAAYQNALLLNRNLLEARFNLGCLWLERDNPEAAKAEFTAYTLRRANAPEGWVKLGFAQLRSREIAPAERSFSEALRHDAQNPDAFNGLGLSQLQRNRPREAAQYFTTALKNQPNHRPALLNLARVLSVYLNDPSGALARYHEYLALKPKPADWEAINAVAEALEHQLVAQQRPAQTNLTTQVVTTSPPPVKTQAVVVKPSAPPKPEPVRPTVISTQQAAAPAEVVTLPPEPIIKTAPEGASPTPAPEPRAVSESEPIVTGAPAQPEKRGFFQKLNPANLFHREPQVTTPLRSTETSAPPAQVASNSSKASTGAAQASQPSQSSARQPAIQRYRYSSPRNPTPGNRSAAERQFVQGVQLRETGRLSDADQLFRQAVKSDPAHFEAQFNLALTEYELKQYKRSLAAWEMALAIRPDSVDARFNFALALKSAGYPLDAANELERILASNPNEARAHLALGNLCAEQLQDTSRARVHYLKVLELSPNHAQASAIRYWLVSNPQ